MAGPVAVVTGSEAFGLTDLWLDGAHQRVTIPMFGRADSLNLATSTAFLLYEVVANAVCTVRALKRLTYERWNPTPSPNVFLP